MGYVVSFLVEKYTIAPTTTIANTTNNIVGRLDLGSVFSGFKSGVSVGVSTKGVTGVSTGASAGASSSGSSSPLFSFERGIFCTFFHPSSLPSPSVPSFSLLFSNSFCSYLL